MNYETSSMTTKILIVEDDPHILLGLEEALLRATASRLPFAAGATVRSKPWRRIGPR